MCSSDLEVNKIISESRYGRPMRISESLKHVLSHQHIFARFYHVKESAISDKSILKKLIRVDGKSIQLYALPRLIEGYLERENVLEQGVISRGDAK